MKREINKLVVKIKNAFMQRMIFENRIFKDSIQNSFAVLTRRERSTFDNEYLVYFNLEGVLE